MHMRQELPDLGTGEHHWEPLRSLRPHQPVEVAERLPQDMLLSKTSELQQSLLSILDVKPEEMVPLG